MTAQTAPDCSGARLRALRGWQRSTFSLQVICRGSSRARCLRTVGPSGGTQTGLQKRVFKAVCKLATAQATARHLMTVPSTAHHQIRLLSAQWLEPWPALAGPGLPLACAGPCAALRSSIDIHEYILVSTMHTSTYEYIPPRPDIPFVCDTYANVPEVPSEHQNNQLLGALWRCRAFFDLLARVSTYGPRLPCTVLKTAILSLHSDGP